LEEKKRCKLPSYDANYDLYQYACKVSAKRFFPNFLNLDAPFNQHEKWNAKDPERFQYEVATMGCRTRVFENRNGEKTSVGRGNLSFSTINLVRIAIELMQTEDKNVRIEKYFEKLNHVLDLTAEQLKNRFDFQKTAEAKQFPLLMSVLWNNRKRLQINDSIEKVIKQGTLGVGFIGLAEALVALTGKHHGESEESQELGLKIITYIRDKVTGFAEETGLNFSVLATPAEGLSGNLPKKTKKISAKLLALQTKSITPILITFRFITNAALITKQKWKLLIII